MDGWIDDCLGGHCEAIVPDLTQASSSHKKLFPATDLLIRLFHFLGSFAEEKVLVRVKLTQKTQKTLGHFPLFTLCLLGQLDAQTHIRRHGF